MEKVATSNSQGRTLSLNQGQSGDQVTLILHSGPVNGAIVEKRSGNFDSRLGLQVKKQRDFPEIGNIRVPKIVRDWDGESYCMDYVPGVVLGTFLRRASHAQLMNLQGELINYFKYLIGNSTLASQPLGSDPQWSMKIHSLRTGITTPAAMEGLEWILTNSKNLPFRRGPNHGDLSYENILVSPLEGQVWLIDMLDSPIDSPLIDLGRILIDLEHGWWKTRSHENATEILARNQLTNAIRDLCLKNSILDLELDLFKTFAALRILPYTKNPMRKAILFSVIKSTIKNSGR